MTTDDHTDAAGLVALVAFAYAALLTLAQLAPHLGV
jgi:hypothetical protein